MPSEVPSPVIPVDFGRAGKDLFRVQDDHGRAIILSLFGPEFYDVAIPQALPKEGALPDYAHPRRAPIPEPHRTMVTRAVFDELYGRVIDYQQTCTYAKELPGYRSSEAADRSAWKMLSLSASLIEEIEAHSGHIIHSRN